MSYEVLNGKVGMTGNSLCVTIPKSFADSEKIERGNLLKKITRQGFMVVVFKEVEDTKLHELIKIIDVEISGVLENV